jgi:hypothetical protein
MLLFFPPFFWVWKSCLKLLLLLLLFYFWGGNFDEIAIAQKTINPFSSTQKRKKKKEKK